MIRFATPSASEVVVEAPIAAQVEERQRDRADGILETARARLQTSSYRPLHEVSCDMFLGVLRLWGEVPSFFLKQIAQTLLMSIDGDYPVQNDLQVASRAQPSQSDFPPRPQSDRCGRPR
jgi:hypothetical protein